MDELKNKRIQAFLMGGIVGLGLIILGLVALIVFDNTEDYVREKTQVAIFVAPENAEIKIDEEVYRNGIYEIGAGNHVVVITATGYTTRAYRFEAKADRITMLYDYLDKTDGQIDEGDVDILRYLVDEEKVSSKIASYLKKLPTDFKFSSESNSPVRNFETLRQYYGESLSDYSYRVIKETLDAFFYFVRKGTKNVRFIDGSFSKTEFRVSADGREEYQVAIELAESGVADEKLREVRKVIIMTEAGTKLFQYDGRFTYSNLDVEYDEETAEPELDYNL